MVKPTLPGVWANDQTLIEATDAQWLEGFQYLETTNNGKPRTYDFDYPFKKLTIAMQWALDALPDSGVIIGEVSPINNDWNGYLDPEHQSSLPAPNGYPGTSGGGEIIYAADQEICYGIFAGSVGATVSSDSDGWTFTGSIYKLFDYTTEQLADIDVNTVYVYLKDQSGVEYFVDNSTSGVNVTKVGGQLKVEITSAIFTGSLTKLWRFFVTESFGRVTEIGSIGFDKILGIATYKDVSGSRSLGVLYTNNTGFTKKIYVATNASVATAVTVVANVNGDNFYGSYTYSIDSAPSLYFEVPPGGDYTVTSPGSDAVLAWREDI